MLGDGGFSQTCQNSACIGKETVVRILDYVGMHVPVHVCMYDVCMLKRGVMFFKGREPSEI